MSEMDSELAELDEFNSKVGSGTGRSDYGNGPTAATPETYDEDEVAPPQVGEETTVKRPKDATMWAVNGINYFPCDESVTELAPAQYEVCHSQQSGFYFKQSNALFDELIDLPDSASEDILKGIKLFWTKEQHYRDFKFLWKRGILLWGPPGSGKTCTLQQLSQMIIKMGGISVYTGHPGHTAQGLAILRRIEPDRPIVVMMEDLDAMITNHGEQDVLALLDGELQIDNVVFVATTNYPERLDKRIVNRPSRFDIVKSIPMPGDAARKVYLQAKNTRLKDAVLDGRPEIDKWVEVTEDFSIAHLKELIVSVEVLEIGFDFAVKRLKTMITKTPKSTDTLPDAGQYA